MTPVRRLLVVVLMACTVASVVGCGIPNDREPHDLTPTPGATTTVQP